MRLTNSARSSLRVRTHVAREWVDRYGIRASEYRLPKSQSQRIAWAERTGMDGIALLTTIYTDVAWSELRMLSAVETLRQVWIQNFQIVDGNVRWRDNENVPPTGRYIASPYDTDARFATKRQIAWTGYKIHLTETYGDDHPHLITNVETTTAAVADDAVTETIHAALANYHLLPDQHVADTGFVNSELFVSSQTKYGIELIGPTRGDNHWQAKAGVGFAARDFTIDWTQRSAVCPMGKLSNSWTPAIDKGKNQVVTIKFATTDCQMCSRRDYCTRSTPPRRTITIRPQAQHEALLAGRQREQTKQFAAVYAQRAGVEGTIAQSVRTCEVRRSRYMGQAKTHLQHVMTAAALNVIRMLRWLNDEPKATTRRSAFARLYQAVT